MLKMCRLSKNTKVFFFYLQQTTSNDGYLWYPNADSTRSMYHFELSNQIVWAQ